MMIKQNKVEDRWPVSEEAILLVLLVAASLLAVYTLLRYAGWWGEIDTSVFTRAILTVFNSGELSPDLKGVYSHGYGFQAVAVFLIHLIGVNTISFQLYASPLLIVWVVIPAWLLYRELTGSSLGAATATAILFVQPEFLFPLLRGSHEKFSRGLMLVCLYLLLRSLRSRGEIARFSAFVLSFYLAAFALITFNSLIATSFILALSLALIFTWIIRRFQSHAIKELTSTEGRLIYVNLSLMIIAFTFVFYIYPPAQQVLQLFQSTGDQIASLFLQVEDTAVNPYSVVASGWINLPVYLTVSMANWLLLGFSAAIWLGQSYHFWIHRKHFGKLNEVLMWSFYAAFAFIAALSVIVDISGAVAANLQHRIFPSFAMVAAPVVARWLIKPVETSSRLHRTSIRWARIILPILAILSVFKATNEPLLSNKWIFYAPAEIWAVRWSEDALADRSLWTEFDERINAGYTIRSDNFENLTWLDNFDLNSETHDLLISNITRNRSYRLGRSLPIEADSIITYDNGSAQVYHLRPNTPFQR